MDVTITDRVGGHDFYWPDHSILIRVSAVKLHSSDSRVTGFITIYLRNKDGGLEKIEPRTSFNFSADQTRARLVKSLLSKYSKNGIPWERMFAKLTDEVQERASEGEPILELWTGEHVEAPIYLLEPLIFEELPSAIFGDKGVAKSTLAMMCYLCLILPWHDNPLGFRVPRESIPAAILDWETNEKLAVYYAERLRVGHDLPAFPVHYRHCARPLADDLEQIHRHLAARETKVVIIDSLALAAGGELNSEAATRFFAALRQLRVASLIIAQNSKDEKTKRKSILGSTLFGYGVRQIFELVKSPDSIGRDLNVSLFHHESNLSAKRPPLAFNLHFNEEGTTINRSSFSVEEFRERVKLPDQIADALKRGGMNYKDIADEIGAKPRDVAVALSRGKGKRFIQLGNESWGNKADDV